MTTNTDSFAKWLVHNEDEVWVKYCSIVERMQERNLMSYVKELETLHKSRSGRRLMLKSKINVDDLIQVNLEDMSYRSRFVEIQIQINRLHRTLEVALDATTNHIMSNHAAQLVLHSGKTKADRAAFVETMLSAGWLLLSRMDNITSICADLIKDIDQAAWATKNLVELIKLSIHHENIVKQSEI